MTLTEAIATLACYTGTPPDELAADRLLDELAALRVIREHMPARRVAVYVSLQSRDPKVTQQAIADADGVTAAAVTQALTKAKAAAASAEG